MAIFCILLSALELVARGSDGFLPSAGSVDFFVVVEMKGVVRSLLDLPIEIKRRNVDVIAGSGYMASSKINPLYEALGLYDMTSAQDVDVFCTQLDAAPHQRLGKIRWSSPSLRFRINKYTFTITTESVGSSGVQLHTDSSFLTVLQYDEIIGGLEVMRKSGTFVAIDPCPDTLLVNLGDIAAVWSNGRFYNVKHLVLCKEVGIRVSITSFLLGPKEAVVETPPELVDSEHPPLYIPFTYEEFRKLRVSKKLHTGEALDLLRTES
ncbi:2-oxoglutarate (2OG) and Fe(II)-dependent oxygenase superfamily protein [Abeliophyllum distichum]|uniref:2-oxoglutarate (2OG) and Fe(II)-dependent oxygenase superfamily protein n=1 Tax=Abeliophyllum distichum TaxID=126358 RepID=A0ABD1SEN6_9LAMI